MIKLHELLAASGDTRDFSKRYELWIHSPWDEECHEVPINEYNLIKYAGCEVLFFSPDYHQDKGCWTVIGVKAE